MRQGAAPPTTAPLPLQVAVGLASVVLTGVAATVSPLLGLAVVLAVAAGLALLLRPDVAAVLGVAVVPVVSGLARSLPVPGLRLSELLTAAVAAGVLLLPRPAAPPWRTLDGLAVLYVALTAGLGLLGALRHDVPLDGTAVGTLTGPVQFLLLYRAVAHGATDGGTRRRALRLVLLLSVPVGLLALGQRVSPRVAELLVRVNGDTSFYDNLEYFSLRVTGPFPHWHVLGGYLLVVVLLAVALLADPEQDVAPAWVLWPVLGLALAAALLTLTAAVLGGIVAGAVVVAGTGRQRARVLAAMGALTLAGAVLAGPLLLERVQEQRDTTGRGDSVVPQSLAYRYDLWTEQYGPVMEGRLLLGYGPTIPPEVTWTYTESLYVSLLLRGGVPLLLAHSALLAAAWVACRRTWRDPSADPARAAAARAVGATTLVLVPMHLVFPYFITTGLPHLWWALLGLTVAGRRTAPRDAPLTAAAARP